MSGFEFSKEVRDAMESELSQYIDETLNDVASVSYEWDAKANLILTPILGDDYAEGAKLRLSLASLLDDPIDNWRNDEGYSEEHTIILRRMQQALQEQADRLRDALERYGTRR